VLYVSGDPVVRFPIFVIYRTQNVDCLLS
jgi:hypothetical protein